MVGELGGGGDSGRFHRQKLAGPIRNLDHTPNSSTVPSQREARSQDVTGPIGSLSQEEVPRL